MMWIVLWALGCGGDSPESEASPHALSASSYRFCHEAGLDAEALARWCEVVDEIPEDRCPGLRASCEGAEPRVSTGGCNEDPPASGPPDGDKGMASEPEPPPEPWSFEEWATPDLAFLGAVSQWLLAILVAAGIGAFVWFLWRRFGGASAPQAPLADTEVLVSVVDEAELDEALPEVPSAPSNDLLALARRALEEGRGGDAVILARGAALRRLGELGRLRLHRSRTDREYVRALERGEDEGEVPEGDARELQVVVAMAERFRFGHQEPPSSSAAAALAAAGRLLGSLAVLWMLTLGATPAAAQTARRYQPLGDAAFAELFRVHGYEVRWRLRGLTELGEGEPELLVLDAAGVGPTEEEWEAVRAWVELGHVLLVVGDASDGFPELGTVRDTLASDLSVAGPVQAAGLEPLVLPEPFSVYRLPAVGEVEAWVLDGAGDAAVASVAIGDGAVLAFADPRLGDNVSLAAPANEELLAELPLLGQAMRGWPLRTPPRVQLAMRPSIVTESNQANNPLESLARAELLPFVLQFLLLWTVVGLWKGWPFGPLRDPPERGRIRFADHVEALGARHARLRASHHALRSYAALWLQRLGPKGLTLAATASGMAHDDAVRFVAELEALVDGDNDEGAAARPSAQQAQADFERMEALWTMVEHPTAPTEESP